MSETQPSIRLDKWLWQARFYKTRTLSAKMVSGGHVRVNEQKVSKPAFGVKVGDGLVFPQADTIKVVRILALGDRRGPAPEAQELYDDLTPIVEKSPMREMTDPEKKGRPTKRDRRLMDAFKSRNG